MKCLRLPANRRVYLVEKLALVANSLLAILLLGHHHFIKNSMGSRKRTYSACSETSEHFFEINERPVEDITLEVFYKPHTITVLSLSVLGLVYVAFSR